MNSISSIEMPTSNRFLQTFSEVLQQADIVIDGEQPWDITLNHPTVPERVLAMGSLGLGESYMDGHWDSEQLDVFFYHILRTHLDQKVQPLKTMWDVLRARLLNLQNIKRAWQVGEHYDIGNQFYAGMLDTRMTYTCGYWTDDTTSLEQAQEAKL